jgi:hypothetical protein
MIPFVTHQAPHLEGAIDGTFSRYKFISRHKNVNRWFITIQSPRYPIFHRDQEIFSQILRLETCVKNPLSCSDLKLKKGFEMGYDQATQFLLSRKKLVQTSPWNHQVASKVKS